jgi:hypothetical protein
MGRIEEAQGRLDRALARLEKATTQSAGSNGSSNAEVELAAMRLRCEKLEDRSREVSERLDAAIDRLHSILSEDNGAG